MRNALVAGTSGLLIAFGAVGLANAANPNVPTYSPYTLMNVPGAVSETVRTSKPMYHADQRYGYDRAAGMSEGRAAYIEDRDMQPEYDREGSRDGYREGGRMTYFPFSLLPWNW